MRRAIILVLLCVRIALRCPDWIISGDVNVWIRAAAYPLFHGNWAHLAVNCLSLWLVFPPKKKGNCRNFFTAYVISLLVYFAAPLPVVGISNLLYATIGMRTPAFSSRWWRSGPVIIFLVVTFAMLFFPQLSGVTHILSFGMGVLVAALRRYISSIENDIRSAERYR